MTHIIYVDELLSIVGRVGMYLPSQQRQRQHVKSGGGGVGIHELGGNYYIIMFVLNRVL